MSKYVDVYLLPIPEKNIEAYRKMSEAAGKIFRKHGALTYREYAASDMKAMDGIISFPDTIKLEPGETLIYASVTFESEEHRNESTAKIFADPEMSEGCEEMTGDNPIFDRKRVVYGGFSILVDV